MTERELFVLLVGLLDTAWPVFYPVSGTYPAPVVAQAWQPQNEGIETGPAIYLTKVADHRYGFTKRDTLPDPDNVKGVIRRETQIYETTFQALAVYKPGDTAQSRPALTASDIANRAAAILQSDYALDVLRAADVGMQRVTDIRNPHIVDGSDEYEAAPTFDFVVTHKQVTLTKAPAASAIDFRQYPV